MPITGRRPTNSGISPYLMRSCGSVWRSSSVSRCEREVAAIGFGIDSLEAQRLLADAAAHHALQADERSAADEEDVGGVDGGELLVRMLASALRRNVGHGAFKNLEQGLLHAFAARHRG